MALGTGLTRWQNTTWGRTAAHPQLHRGGLTDAEFCLSPQLVSYSTHPKSIQECKEEEEEENNRLSISRCYEEEEEEEENVF